MKTTYHYKRASFPQRKKKQQIWPSLKVTNKYMRKNKRIYKSFSMITKRPFSKKTLFRIGLSKSKYNVQDKKSKTYRANNLKSYSWQQLRSLWSKPSTLFYNPCIVPRIYKMRKAKFLFDKNLKAWRTLSSWSPQISAQWWIQKMEKKRKAERLQKNIWRSLQLFERTFFCMAQKARFVCTAMAAKHWSRYFFWNKNRFVKTKNKVFCSPRDFFSLNQKAKYIWCSFNQQNSLKSVKALKKLLLLLCSF